MKKVSGYPKCYILFGSSHRMNTNILKEDILEIEIEEL